MNEPDAAPLPLGDAMALAIEATRDGYRLAPSEGWYLLLPPWIVYRCGTFEQFAAEFDESVKRTGIWRLGVIGFETQWDNGHVRRHRISWLDGGAPQPTTGKDPG